MRYSFNMTQNIFGVLEFIKQSKVNDGCSWGILFGMVYPDSGYMVALAGRELRTAGLNQFVVADYMASNADKLLTPAHYLGSWHNKDDHQWYLDVSVREYSKEKAIELGIQNGQKAIWDCANGCEITLPTGE